MASDKQPKNSPPPQLTPWKPGQSGNPKGRPKSGHAFTEELRKRLPKSLLADKLRELVEEGNVAAIKYAYDRLEGTPTQTIDQKIDTSDNEMLELLRTAVYGPSDEPGD